MEIANRVAIVTGGARRVGQVVALALAEKGAHVAFTYRSGDPRETLEGIRAHGVEGMALCLDVLEWDEPKAVVEQVIERLGRVDILVNNASVWQSAPFLEITRQQWETSIGANLTGPFLCAQAVAPHMLRQESGHIVNISDLSAHQTWPRFADHSASKAGLEALTRVMAAESGASRASERHRPRHHLVARRRDRRQTTVGRREFVAQASWHPGGRGPDRYLFNRERFCHRLGLLDRWRPGARLGRRGGRSGLGRGAAR